MFWYLASSVTVYCIVSSMNDHQLSLFGNVPPQPILQNAAWKIFVDGASRKNPGPAGAGIYILKNGTVYSKLGFYLGTLTNNQAEYSALFIALWHLRDELAKTDTLEICADSQLLIRHMKREYNVKNERLVELAAKMRPYIVCTKVVFTHIMREKNTVADELANYGIDKKIAVPQACQRCLD